MIAAAMATRKSSTPLYADLVRAGASISREIQPNLCARLGDATLQVEQIKAQLEFAVDADQRPCVNGQVSAEVTMACHLCTQPVALEIVAPVEGALAMHEAQAQAWQEQDSALSIIEVSGQTLDVVELIEDELLLKLPLNVCRDEACENRPQLGYGPSDAEVRRFEPRAEDDSGNPFAALAQLKEPKPDV